MDVNAFCAPGINGRGYTCFDRSGLIRIINKYNQYYPQRKIRYNSDTPDHILWKMIRDGLADVCHDQEYCWLDQEFLKEDRSVQKYYKPPIPPRPHQWLSTSDIDNVLKQYEILFPNFIFMGTVPIDFDDIIREYRYIDICRLYRGEKVSRSKPVRITKYGFVFNLDPHDQRGSHWVSMFLSLSSPHIFIGFFDSYGTPPPIQIVKLIRRLKKQIKNCFNVDIPYKCNTIQHQHKNSECGVYSMYFIYRCLMGDSFETITENIILDDAINRFRHFFFRPTIHYQKRNKRT
ncbi:MAG: Ulp1 family isopeptidase [candidate division WOR-3 bacterium]